ncbi:hypothetical protein ACWCQ0_25490 [Streptomyces massasporeus]|uniref:Chromosome partition protein Smc n=1 Tax=Streptomyces massasporeus TaxID=67324 RepID=A0ABW6LN34_9ACTN
MMSGKKSIQVEESEWYRIQRQASQFKDVLRDLPSLIDDVRRRTRADLDESFAAVEQRHLRTEQVIAGLSEQTRQLEADTTRRLRAQARQTQEALRATEGALRAETRELLAAQQRELRSEIEAETAARKAETARLADQLRAMGEDHARAEAAARAWLGDGRTMAALIRDTLPHERYAPRRLAALETRLTTAEGSIGAGRYDAALAVAQEAFLGLSELRLDVERLDLENRVAGSEAAEAVTVVGRLVERSERLPVKGPDGEALPHVELDVDHWTHGDLTKLRDDVGAALARATDERLSTEELRALVTDEVPALQERLGETVERARMTQLASQLRVNLADAVARTLDDTAGYRLEAGQYADQDERGSFYAKLSHENGNEIVIDIAPGSSGSGGSVLRILSYDYDVTAETELQERARAVRGALRGEGHEAGEAVSEPGTPTVTEPSYVQLSTEQLGGRATRSRS